MTRNDPIPANADERPALTTSSKKKLIEVSLPLEAINAASGREKSIRHGHPSTMHLWWSRKPLATARAVLFAQLVDDPSSRPEEFPTSEDQQTERSRLHRLIERLIAWESSSDNVVIEEARREIRKSNDGVLPEFLDPFAGGGSIPLEAQRLGLSAHASDLNPVAVILEKALIEYPPKFSGRPPVHPDATVLMSGWSRAQGLAEDIRRYGEWMRNEAFKRIGHLYPEAIAPGGTSHTVIAWKWARTVRSPNPANPIESPITSSWWLSKARGRGAYVVPHVSGDKVSYEVVHSNDGPAAGEDGTRVGRGAKSISDGTPISADYIKSEGAAGRMGAHLLAIVAETDRGRLYISPSHEHVAAADVPIPVGIPDEDLPFDPRNIWTPSYGLTKFSDLFTNRQLVALTTFGGLIKEVRDRVLADASATGAAAGDSLESGGTGAQAYAEAVALYLSLAVSRCTDYNSSLTSWNSSRDGLRNTFVRQAIPMTWDYAEANPFSNSSGNIRGQIEWVARAVEQLPAGVPGDARQASASSREYSDVVISTDPPYYDYINYSDLSDYFYVWMRRSLLEVLPRTVETMLTPKNEELVANPYRHAGKAGAEKFFVSGFNSVFDGIRRGASDRWPMTVYYAYKQQEGGKVSDESQTSGWYTILTGLIDAGWEITATWPMRSERGGRLLSLGSNALASSIVLACRPRPLDAPTTTRRAFSAALKAELPSAVRTLMQGEIAPVDLAQASIGPGVGVFSRFSRVREADGSDMSVRDALLLINATLDEVIGEQESDFDPDTRFAIKWYRQYGWLQENSGIADQLARSSDTSIGALERGGIFEARGGKARLVSPSQLEDAWDVGTDERVSIWEATVRLAAVMAKHGADEVAALLPAVQTRLNLDAVKELGFLLFHEAEKKRDTKDAILFNGLVSAWGDVNEQARKHAGSPRAVQQAFDFDEDED